MRALLRPIRRGGSDVERLLRYADGMLAEREFFIRKAIGWVLREISKKRPEMTADYLAALLDHVAALTLRERSRRLPPDRRDALMAAYRPDRAG
jgi:3-methyladenine DNA glycosylase AlkD